MILKRECWDCAHLWVTRDDDYRCAVEVCTYAATTCEDYCAPADAPPPPEGVTVTGVRYYYADREVVRIRVDARHLPPWEQRALHLEGMKAAVQEKLAQKKSRVSITPASAELYETLGYTPEPPPRTVSDAEWAELRRLEQEVAMAEMRKDCLLAEEEEMHRRQDLYHAQEMLRAGLPLEPPF